MSHNEKPAAQQAESGAPDEPLSAKMHDVVVDLREYAGNPGYSHGDYADTMRQAAHTIEALRAQLYHWSPALAAQSQGAQPLRYTSDGALAECPCCGSLDVGGAHNTVHCYTCDLTIKRVGPLQNAMDAWNRRTNRAALAAKAEAPAPRTELSKRIREAATADVTLTQAKLLIGAAEEIERAQQAAALTHHQ